MGAGWNDPSVGERDGWLRARKFVQGEMLEERGCSANEVRPVGTQSRQGGGSKLVQKRALSVKIGRVHFRSQVCEGRTWLERGWNRKLW